MKKSLIILILLLGSVLLFSQNLIQNPSFEVVVSTVTGFGQISKAAGWNKSCSAQPNASPDLFDRLSSDCLHRIPSNKWSYNKEVRVNGTHRYAGFVSSEPIMGSIINSSLAAGRYNISFYVSNVDGHLLGCDPMADVLGNGSSGIEVTLIKSSTCKRLLVWVSPTSSSTNWTEFSGNFDLAPAAASVGYDKVEFNVFNTSGLSTSVIYFDDVKLELTCGGYDKPEVIRIENTNYQASPPNHIEQACEEIYAGFDVGANGPNGNVFANGDAIVTYQAGESIHLHDGFLTKPNITGKFHAFIDPACGCDPIPYPTVSTNKEMFFCQNNDNSIVLHPSSPLGLGGVCSGGAPFWTAIPSTAISWLSNQNICNPTITPNPNDGPRFVGSTVNVVFTLTVVSSLGLSVSDIVEVQINDCSIPFRKKNGNLNNRIADNLISIYPNPNEGLFTIDYLSKSDEPYRYKIYNISGQLILEGKGIGKKQLDLTNYPDGVYSIKIRSGDKISRQKLIKSTK
ncbi:MAG: T9SS type A sorting domain-containing protein [Flavobacteriales bacterium]|nr:T9SS type A sorting domain-containing protein [Flavobacteriales bacterium]